MFEINLGCPECGGLEWIAADTPERFECVHCGRVCGFEDMEPQAFKG